MSGFIVLNDGRAWSSSNEGFDAVITSLAEYIKAVANDLELYSWLLEQRSIVLGPGLGGLDLRELTPRNQELILDAVENVCGGIDLEGDLIHWEKSVRLLAAMVRSYKNGEPPSALNPQMKDVLPSTNKRSGPGW